MKDILINSLYYLGCGYLLRRKKLANQTVTILSLHRINNEIDYCWQSISILHFENLLKYVAKYYQVCFFSELAQYIHNNKKPLLILSFDDGYYDFVENALPLLQRYNLKSNHNLVVACLEQNLTIWTQHFNQIFNHLYKNKISETIEWNGQKYTITEFKNWYITYQKVFYAALQTEKKERTQQIKLILKQLNLEPKQEKMMNWEDAKNCLQTGLVEIGSHTLSHESLVAVQNKAQLKLEIGLSMQMLSDKLSTKIDILALPNGQNNKEIIDLATKAGYSWLLETGDNNFKYEQNAENNLKIASRINIENEAKVAMNLRIENFQATIRRFLSKT